VSGVKKLKIKMMISVEFFELTIVYLFNIY